jgi:hypothetical protein
MTKLAWYWHRLRAMNAGEMALHARKKFRQFIDARRERDWGGIKLEGSGAFPKIPPPSAAPEELRAALRRDVEDILHGRWKAFGHLDIRVDDPPRWHKDYFADVDLETSASAFELNHRALPRGADVKLIWELSRWHQLVRLAMTAHVLDDERAAEKCILWLEDWVKHNPPFRGWNWTSALEAGMRLVQFTWIDALLAPHAERWGFETELDTLRYEILPPHVWFTWRHKSFGSSANNHLIGELAGLILATVRWPALAKWGTPVENLRLHFEREVCAQFAPDGGNREQALNYQLFSFEFCWQARMALAATGAGISSEAHRRLVSAASFFWTVQWNGALWAYGDSDDAFVTPFFTSANTCTREWRDWVANKRSRALEYWLDGFPESPKRIAFGPPTKTIESGPWWWYRDTGIAVAESGFWWLRWDLSPLGYLATAAHGHLDALHLSVWFKGVPFVIDPGTGAYYADKRLREWLASRAAHNGPCPEGPEFPKRLGPFLWERHHAEPVLNEDMTGVLDLPGVQLRRRVIASPAQLKWTVEDSATAQDGRPAAFSVRWQFAPGTTIKRLSARSFMLRNGDVHVTLEVCDNWAEVTLVEQRGDGEERRLPASTGAPELQREFAGTVSPGFRQTAWGPCLKLVAKSPHQDSCVFQTAFVASAPS